MVRRRKKDFFHAIDTPLSALAFNCLQLTCFEPAQESYCDYRSSSQDCRADWMGQFCEAHPDSTATLRDMVIPGTHNSASSTISKLQPFSSAGRTQNCGVGAQLGAGARYLDLRIAASGTSPNILSIWHGCLEGGDFGDVLQEISDFVREHPKELIILEVVPEYGRAFSRVEKQQSLDMVLQHLTREAIIPGAELAEIFDRKAVTELIASRRKIAVLVHNRYFEGGENSIGMTEKEIEDQYGFAVSCKVLVNPWHNMQDTQKLLHRNLEVVKTFQKSSGRILSNQFFATASAAGFNSIAAALVGRNSLCPISHAYKLYAAGALDGFLRQNADNEWNIVSLDFIDLCPDIVDFLIALNWKHRLEILKAAVQMQEKHLDVTATVQSMVCRESVLFLVDPKADLGLDAEQFTLSLAYRIGFNTQFSVMTLDVNNDCSIVLSAFGCNEGAVTMVELPQGQGFVKRGKLYANQDDVPRDETCGTLFFYQIVGGSGNFEIV